MNKLKISYKKLKQNKPHRHYVGQNQELNYFNFLFEQTRTIVHHWRKMVDRYSLNPWTFMECAAIKDYIYLIHSPNLPSCAKILIADGMCIVKAVQPILFIHEFVICERQNCHLLSLAATLVLINHKYFSWDKLKEGAKRQVEEEEWWSNPFCTAQLRGIIVRPATFNELDSQHGGGSITCEASHHLSIIILHLQMLWLPRHWLSKEWVVFYPQLSSHKDFKIRFWFIKVHRLYGEQASLEPKPIFTIGPIIQYLLMWYPLCFPNPSR